MPLLTRCRCGVSRIASIGPRHNKRTSQGTPVNLIVRSELWSVPWLPVQYRYIAQHSISQTPFACHRRRVIKRRQASGSDKISSAFMHAYMRSHESSYARMNTSNASQKATNLLSHALRSQPPSSLVCPLSWLDQGQLQVLEHSSPGSPASFDPLASRCAILFAKATPPDDGWAKGECGRSVPHQIVATPTAIDPLPRDQY